MCATVLTGENMDDLVAAGVEHWGSTHPEFGLNEPSIRNYFEGEIRIDGPVGRLSDVGEIEIRMVSPDTRDDVVEFFDRRAFAGNPAWGMCYCMFHHLGGRQSEVWLDRTWQENRSDISARIDAGTTTGVVAYVDGELAGWCNATARSEFPSHSGEDDEGVGSIVCFVVAPPYRNHGVSRALLGHAVTFLGEAGFSIVEAYPIVKPERNESAYVGTLELYQDAGFTVTSEDPLVVGKSLN